MSLSNHDRIGRFYNGRPTPPSSSYGINSRGERLFSYGYELARHGVEVFSAGADNVVMIRDRCDSSPTTNRHHRAAYSPGCIPISPDNYPERVDARPALIPFARAPLEDVPMKELWQLWLDKLEQEYGKDARAYAVRRLKRFRRKLEMKQLIDAL